MRRARSLPTLALLLALLLPTSGSLTQLTVDASDPPTIRAGSSLQRPIEIGLDGPLASMPGASGPVQVDVASPDAAGCTLDPTLVLLDPIAARASAQLTCKPTHPGQHALNVTARSPPHGPGWWNRTLPVLPDLLSGSLDAGTPDAFEIPLSLEATPSNLAAAPVNVTLAASLEGTPLGMELAPRPFTARPAGPPFEHALAARHGPGTYRITALLEGPQTEALELATNATVPEPPSDASFELNVTVEPGQPTVALTSDSVNDDGKHKRPGDTLITRLDAAYTERVNVTVHRVAGERLVPIDRQTLTPDADGEIEHTFSHPVLPVGRLVVEAQTGGSAAARTARIMDIEAEATVSSPASILADGRAVPLTIQVEDENHGSTPEDPGPVFGLPDLTWRMLRGSRTAEGWNVSIGPFGGGSEGSMQTSAVPWPAGSPGVTVGDGSARMDGWLDPPSGVKPGSYRLSIYDPDGERIGGTTVELTAPPELELHVGDPHPGDPLGIELETSNAPKGFTAAIELHVDDERVANTTAGPIESLSLPLPGQLPAGTPVAVQAYGDWSGRPPTDRPDAFWQGEVPSIAPTLDPSSALDGVPASSPIPVHPGWAHTLQVAPGAWDPNGDRIELSASITGPEGTDPGWPVAVDDLVTVEIPDGAEPGRYHLQVEAWDSEGGEARTIALDVAPLARLGLSGPSHLEIPQGQQRTLDLDLSNLGTRPFEDVLASVHAPDGLSIRLAGTSLDPDAPTPLGLPLPAGAKRTASLEVDAANAPAGAGSIQIRIAGVLS